ncbi:erythronolide synthase [Candidatus Moduliflexus flocculans]|uniref:Erythronolide synthase n=1 Tax=Candidatus Moduliflexus flocculans TaxID=1499966 RepID=A0A081BMS7_9BACT|nr:erythronolide synthase [Candidatus Moduliflexus flocculans]
MENATRSALTPQHASPIAIIGIGCIFPQSRNLQEYWTLVKEGRDAITDVPETHWKLEEYFDNDPKTRDKTYGAKGGFLPPIEFDPLAFGIVPNTLEAIDTSQLLSLLVAQETLRDAGYLRREFDRNRASVILGVTGTQELVIPLGARLGHPLWRKALKDAGFGDDIAQDVIERIQQQYVEWQENSFPGLLGNVIAGRIANRFDFGGTNCTVDAACASSLSALHLSMLELQSGKADMVLTGGVDAFNHIFMYICFSKTPALSPGGHARPFDEQCDGTTLGEGIGMVMLKRLADAERDGDKIYAVIRGIGSSSDGKGTAIYAPAAKGQVKAYLNAYRDAQVTPETIELIEAHGTGTAVGDATEITGLKEIFQPAQTNGSWCALGSVKSQIGHAKSAAGVAGLIKVALALHHKTLPPTIKVEKPTKTLASGQTPFYVNTQKRPWAAPKTATPRRAGLSAFGFGGTNFHCVLEEYAPRKTQIDWTGETQILAFSGATITEIQAALDNVSPEMSWDALRRAAAKSRKSFDSKQAHRLIIVVEKAQNALPKMLKNARAMLEKKQGKAAWNTPDGIFYGSGATPGKLGVIFPGQGSQYVGMLRDLSCQFPQFQDTLDVANRVFADGTGGKRLSDLMYPHPVFSDEERETQALQLQSTQVAQPAIGAASLGAFETLKTFGVQPDEVAGHSYGELVALCAAGVLDVETFFAMSKLRGQLMGQKSGDKGSMLAVNGDLTFVQQLIKNEGIDLVIANKNAPQQTVLSGATKEVERAAALLKAKDIRCKQLSVAAAFHSAFVADASGAFLDALQQVEISMPTLPVYADSTAQLYPNDAAEIRKLLAGQLANPVEFVGIIERMYERGVRTFFEVGPSSQMNGLIKAILEGKAVDVLSLDASKGQRSGEADIARVLSQLATSGYAIRLAEWDNDLTADEEPAQKGRKMAVTLCGANYVSPKAAKPPVAKPLAVSTPPAAPTPTAAKTPVNPPASQPKAPATPKPAISVEPKTVKSETTQRQTSTPSTPFEASPAPSVMNTQPSSIGANRIASGFDLSDALRMTQDNLRALQQFQQQTADAHRQFLEGQDATRQTFERLFNQQQQLVFGQIPLHEGVTGGVGVEKQIPLQGGARGGLSVESAPAFETQAQPTPIKESKTAQPVETHPQPLPGGELAAAQPVMPPAPIAVDSSRVEKIVLSIVAEKTGYPPDMLELDMGLDADLGIDSIKRVEILSALQAQLPDAPEISSQQIGSLRTLRQIVETLGASTTTAAAPKSETSANAQQVESILLEVVSEKTGYPKEMLELDMGLDADLGIDSIKRVEIFSALQSKLPNSPEIGSDQIGRLRSLRQIVEVLGTHPSNGNGAQGHVPAAFEDADVTNVLLQVVAEKTGYPEDMLDLDMGLDADLGIDSIKRVEIFSALQSKLPNSPEIGSDQIGRFHNLRQIVELFTPKISTSSRIPIAQPAGAHIDEKQVETVLLQVVSEKTGYPEDMLDLDMALDADLGIDSIKRVEIFSALQHHLPSAPEITSEQIGRLQSLRQILSALARPAYPVRAKSEPTPAASSDADEETEADPAPETTLDRYIVVPVKISQNVTRETLSLPSGATVWIVGNVAPFAVALEKGLRQKGLQIEHITLKDAATKTIPDTLRGMVIVAPPHMDEESLKQAFGVVRAAAAQLKNAPSLLVTVSRLDGQFGFGGLDAAANALSGGLAGLTKTAAREWPNVHCKALDVSPQCDDEQAASAVIDEMFFRSPLEVGIVSDGRYALKLKNNPVRVLNPDRVVPPNDVILITGGARGVTAECAVALAKAWQPTLMLIGRTPLPQDEPAWLATCQTETEIKQAVLAHAERKMTPKEVKDECQRILTNREIRDNLRRIERAGSRVAYRSVDARDAAAVQRLINETKQEFGAIAGLIHGAGVLADKKIEDKTDAQFESVIATKVGGAINFLNALNAEPLKLLVFFSSTTARFGRIGQVDYAIANEALNKFAQQQTRLRPDCRVMAMNWGPWAGGMVTPALERLFEKEQIRVIPLRDGAEALIREIAAPETVEVLMLGKGSVLPDVEFVEKPATAANLSVGFERVLSIETHPFLVSHVMNGRAVLPTAIIIEWLGHAALHLHPGLLLHGFDNLKILKGVILRKTETVQLQAMVGGAQKEGKTYRVPVELQSLDAASGKLTRHASAELILTGRLPHGERIFDKNLRFAPYAGGEIYQHFLFHGKDLQGIQQIEGCSEAGIAASVLAAPAPSAWMSQPLRQRWLADPLMLDSAFQLLIVWSFMNEQNGSLPSAIGQYRQFVSKFPPDGGRIAAKIVNHEQHRAIADIEFYDRNGDLLANIEGYECTIDASLNAAFRRNALE